MTLREAQILAELAEDADGGCLVCVESTVDFLNEKFPAFRWDLRNRKVTARKLTMSERRRVRVQARKEKARRESEAKKRERASRKRTARFAAIDRKRQAKFSQESAEQAFGKYLP